MVKRNKKKQLKIFAFTLSICLMVFGLGYGLSMVYVNTYNADSAEKIEVLDVQRVSYNTAEVTVFNNTYDVKIKPSNGVERFYPYVYFTICAKIRVIFAGLDYITKKFTSIC